MQGGKQSIKRIGVLALLPAAGYLALAAIVKLIGYDLPWYVLLLLSLVFLCLGVFWAGFVDWLYKLSESKKLKYFVLSCLLVIVILWLGWPWQRVRNLASDVIISRPIISENWISEKQAEEHVLTILQDSLPSREILLQRVRAKLVYNSHEYRVRIKCFNDTTWDTVGGGGVMLKRLSITGYDGSYVLGESTGCAIEYPVQYIYRDDWPAIYLSD